MKCESTKIVKPEPYFEAVFEGSLFAFLDEFDSVLKLIPCLRDSRIIKMLDHVYANRSIEIDREENRAIAKAIIKHNGWTVPDDMPIKLTVK